jgi:hypothetical protein
MSQQRSRTATAEPSGWARGGVVFGACAMVIAGTFQALNGIAAISNDKFYITTNNYTFDVDVSTWGWIHLVVGVLLLVCGIALFSRRMLAVIAALLIAGLSALVNFFFIPYYPIWALVVIGLDVWVIWSLTREGVVFEP